MRVARRRPTRGKEEGRLSHKALRGARMRKCGTRRKRKSGAVNAPTACVSAEAKREDKSWERKSAFGKAGKG